MFRSLRTIHKWAGLISSLILMTIAVTGFFLAVKGKVSWMRPPVVPATAVKDFKTVVSPGVAMEIAFAQNLADLKDPSDVDRVDYRPKDNTFKVLSKKGYHEVQVDGSTGQVLQVATRNDSLMEDIHDLSFFAEWTHEWLLPSVAVILFMLSTSGVVMFFTPVVRRWKFKRQGQAAKGPPTGKSPA